MGRFSANKTASTTAPVETNVKETAMDTDVFDDDDFDTEPEVVEPEVSTEETEEVVEAEPDITGFIELVDSLVDRDDSNDVALVGDDGIKSIREAYVTLSRKEKSLAKKALNDKMEAAVMSDETDITLARFYLDVHNRMTETVKAPKGTGSTAKKVDPSEAVVKLIAKLDLARALVVIPEGFDEDDIRARAAALFEKGAEDVKNDDPELVWVRQAKNLAAPKGGKISTGGTRRRHSVANHIAEAFANAEPGESLTVAQIANFKSDEYGDDSPTKQAILLHLQSKKFQAASAVSVAEGDDGETVLVKK